MEKMRDACTSVGHPQEQRIWRPKRRLENDIKLDVSAIRWDSVERIQRAQNGVQMRTLVNMAMNCQVP
jgi:hypothetical protein